MSCRRRWKKLMCCCENNTSDKELKKRANEHKYCGCRESRKQRSKMQTPTCDADRRSLVDNEVVEALEYGFQDGDAPQEECFLEGPAVPFNHELRTPLHPNADIILQGIVKDNTSRFAINLLVNRGEHEDIAFHFNPRLDEEYCARNALFNGKWGYEEGTGQTKFPFRRGRPFHVEIFLTHSEFLVAVNGIHFCSYTYRTSVLNITQLQVWGSVRLLSVHITNSNRYPGPLPADYPPSPYKFHLKVPGITRNVSEVTPVYGILQERLSRNSRIEIKGRVQLLPFAFYVNLQEGSHVWPHPDIPLHLSVRFNQRGNMVMLANSWLLDTWGKEEMVKGQFLFYPGYPYIIEIECLQDAFIVKVEEQIILTFKHRMPCEIVDTIHIQGDVFVYDINICL